MKQHWLKIYILIVGSAIFVLVGVLWFGISNYTRAGKLWQYAPRETDFFVEINLADKNLVDFLQQNRTAKDMLEKFLLDNDLPAELWKSENELIEVGMFIIKADKEGEKNKSGWIIRTRGDAGQLGVYLGGYYYTTAKANIAVISREKEPIREIENKNFFNKMSRDQEKRMKGSLAGGFWDLDFWPGNLDVAWPLKNIVKANFKITREAVFWQITKREESFDLFLEWPAGVEKQKIEAVKTNKDVYFIEGAMVLNIWELGDIWEKIAAGNIDQYLDRAAIEEYLNNKYKIRVDRLYTIFEQPFFLVVQPTQKSDGLYKNYQSGINHYVLDASVPSGQDGGVIISELESFMRSYMAYKFPEKRLKVLPDKTSGYEVVANPDKFLLATEKYGEGDLRYIRKDNFEVGYYLSDKKLMIFDSVELAKSVLDNKNREVPWLVDRNSECLLDPNIFGWQIADFIRAVGMNFEWGVESFNVRATLYNK